MTIEQLLQQWLDQLTVAQNAVHTRLAYQRDVEALLAFCQQQHIDPLHLHLSDLRQYMGHCVEHKGWSNATIQRNLSAIRQFMQWLQKQGVERTAHIQDFKIKRQPTPLPGMLTAQDVQRLLDQPEPEQPRQQWLWCRDKAMLELLYSSGLRLHELVELRLTDIDFDQCLVRVTGKGSKTRIVPFGQPAKRALTAWLLLRAQQHCNHHFVFTAEKGAAISDRQVQNRIKIQAQRAGLPADIHPHLLRHCFASHLLSNGSDLRAIQEMLGHQQLSTTQIYTHLDYEYLAKTYRQAHPRAKKALQDEDDL